MLGMLEVIFGAAAAEVVALVELVAAAPVPALAAVVPGAADALAAGAGDEELEAAVVLELELELAAGAGVAAATVDTLAAFDEPVVLEAVVAVVVPTLDVGVLAAGLGVVSVAALKPAVVLAPPALLAPALARLAPVLAAFAPPPELPLAEPPLAPALLVAVVTAVEDVRPVLELVPLAPAVVVLELADEALDDSDKAWFVEPVTLLYFWVNVPEGEVAPVSTAVEPLKSRLAI
jgi:hypothetical protein